MLLVSLPLTSDRSRRARIFTLIIPYWNVLFIADFHVRVYIETIPTCVRGPLDEGDSIEIACYVLHHGDVKWFKIDPTSKLPQQIIDKSKVNDPATNHLPTGHWEKNLTLTMRNVKRSDRGVYVCSKSNGYNATKNHTVVIDVAGKLISCPDCFILPWKRKDMG